MANRDLTPWRSQGLPALGRDPFSSFRREMDRLFEDFFAPAEARSFAASERAQMVMPSIDVHETEQAYTVTAELPGIEQKDIDLNLSDNALTLRGEKRSERKEEDGGRRYSERTYGRFERTIPFESEIDADRVEASCENGILKIVLPKNAQARDRTRRIEIRGGAGGAEPGAGVAGRTSAGQSSAGQSSAGQSSAGQSSEAPAAARMAPEGGQSAGQPGGASGAQAGGSAASG